MRCPKVSVVEQPCADLAGAIEQGRAGAELDAMVSRYVAELLERTNDTPPERAILGCTHFPLVEKLFVRHLPPATRLLSQPQVVADSLEDYLTRHPRYGEAGEDNHAPRLLTTGNPDHVSRSLELFWPRAPAFEALGPSHTC